MAFFIFCCLFVFYGKDENMNLRDLIPLRIFFFPQLIHNLRDFWLWTPFWNGFIWHSFSLLQTHQHPLRVRDGLLENVTWWVFVRARVSWCSSRRQSWWYWITTVIWILFSNTCEVNCDIWTCIIANFYSAHSAQDPFHRFMFLSLLPDAERPRSWLNLEMYFAWTSADWNTLPAVPTHIQNRHLVDHVGKSWMAIGYFPKGAVMTFLFWAAHVARASNGRTHWTRGQYYHQTCVLLHCLSIINRRLFSVIARVFFLSVTCTLGLLQVCATSTATFTNHFIR